MSAGDGRVWPLCGPPRTPKESRPTAIIRADSADIAEAVESLRQGAAAADRVRAHLDGDTTYASVRAALDGAE